MNFFLPSVCFGLVFLIMVFGDGLVVAVAKLFITALVFCCIRLFGRPNRQEDTV